MKLKLIVSIFSFLMLLSSHLFAQTDPWITKIYKELYNRVPTADETNIKNYNKGSWANYDQLKKYIQDYQAAKSSPVKGDPWIFQIYKELYNRQPNVAEVNIKNYNGGSWTGYDDLKKHVQAFQSSLSQQGLKFETVVLKDKPDKAVVGLFQNGQQIAVNIVGTNGGNIIAAGGASIVAGGAGNIVAGGAGNIVAGGAGNIVAGGAGNIVAGGAGNIAINANIDGYNFGSSRTIQSTGIKVLKTSGTGALIVKKG